MSAFRKLSYLDSISPEYIDDIFDQYTQNPNSVDESWQYFFDGLGLGQDSQTIKVPVDQASTSNNKALMSSKGIDLSAEAKVAGLINAYRERGSLIADLDPLHPPLSTHVFLNIERFGLTNADLKRTFTAGKLIGLGECSLEEIINKLKRTYCSSIAVEFTHIQDEVSRDWLVGYMEGVSNHVLLPEKTKKYIFSRLNDAESFEYFLHTRFVAQKRFSIQGGESLIPALDNLVDSLAKLGVEEVVFGMAHRGRLNVLHNIFKKDERLIFSEFLQKYEPESDERQGEGDVKYHMGFSADVRTVSGASIHLVLANNPSHLEFVSPVVIGMARAKQKERSQSESKHLVAPVIIHGDAAFAGQGVVYETLNLSQIPGYAAGGSIHIVINNQVGFTTNPEQARSTTYATDVAKMLEVPIFHVNGDDPEAIWYVMSLAAAYRQKFKKDVIIDLICYRKYGHNEGDEPSFTQPILYKKIKKHGSPRVQYLKRLVAEGVISDNEAEGLFDSKMDLYDQALDQTKKENPCPVDLGFKNKWTDFKFSMDKHKNEKIITSIDRKQIDHIINEVYEHPQNFVPNPKIKRIRDMQKKMLVEQSKIDWGMGELLCYGSLLTEGHGIRLTGQDVERGTFSHRNALLKDFETGENYIPLKKLGKTPYDFQVYNSILSETACLGFEYGWSSVNPNDLVIWEAQFGDFANGAQVIIDQFIVSGESKWNRASGLVMYLPHGYEGQGPEHSSARFERFLQMCGKMNMYVCNYSTPAQLFHGIRKHLKRKFRKPLVLMSPKKLLRNCFSTVEDITQGEFQKVIDDHKNELGQDKNKIEKLLLCSGKFYYELQDALLAHPEIDEKIAVLRVEQLHPWPMDELSKMILSYPNVKSIHWVQEEPRNMGAWTYVFNTWMGGYSNYRDQVAGMEISYIGQGRGAAPAVGNMKIHNKIHKEIIAKALNLT